MQAIGLTGKYVTKKLISFEGVLLFWGAYFWDYQILTLYVVALVFFADFGFEKKMCITGLFFVIFTTKLKKSFAKPTTRKPGLHFETVTYTLSKLIKIYVLLSMFITIILNSRPAITCSKLKIETLEQGVKYVQS